MTRLFALLLLLFVTGAQAQSRVRDSLENEARDLESRINREREVMINSLNMLISFSPEGRYVNDFYFRLGELKYEKAVIDFENKVNDYEEEYAKYEKGLRKDEPEYPKYDFSGVLGIYREILKRDPDSKLADRVLYFAGLCHKKADSTAKANAAFELLVRRFPQSEYYLDAMMEIGTYYFNNPSSNNGKGYEKAIETYKEVLKYRDSDKFIEALYRLAWAYYMIDKYTEAVTVFRHLIEEIDMAENFGETTAASSKNPMFREEAIEYIAVSLCEVNDLAQVTQFLEMIGNKEYSLMILNRMGQYYEEQLDYDQAMACYRLMVDHYPWYGRVVDGRMGIVRCYERREQIDSALAEKEIFFSLYARGGEWQKRVKSDVWRRAADSLSIKCVLSVAQFRFAEARKSGSQADYRRTLDAYARMIGAYADAPEAYEADWSRALIYEQNLSQFDSARVLYMALSTVDGGRHQLQASINAIAVAQRIEEKETPAEGEITAREARIVEACQNYVNRFPGNPDVMEVAFIPASIYFNRKNYARALKTYQLIIQRAPAPADPKALEARLYEGQCYTGLKDFEGAEKSFNALFEIAPEGKFRDEAKTRRVESAFQNAELRRFAKDYAEAARLFLAIEEKYPYFENMDVVLFNAADAREKLQQWGSAAEIYRRISRKFPASKLADGALFNGALCFEGDSAYAEAIVNYELLVDRYPGSGKAKDALYNIGLCYEKLKAYDKMAEAQERYAEKYPDAKEVEAMLFSSARFFLEAKKPDRARRAYESYIRRYPGSSGEIEARYQIALIQTADGDRRGAEESFRGLIERNESLKAIGKSNDYFAAEASYQMAEMVRERYEAVRFKLPVKAMADQQKEKADLLKKTVEAYTRVVQARSERIFEAAYRIGEAYSHFAKTYYEQERDPKLDATKQIVFERDLNLAMVDLAGRCIEPHLVNLGFGTAVKADSLKPEQRKYLALSRAAVSGALLSMGSYLLRAPRLLLSSPVPDKIRKMPVQFYLYQQKLSETVQPLFNQAFDQHLASVAKAKDKNLGDTLIRALGDSMAQILFERGQVFERLASEILNKPQIPKEMSADERDEITFQLEDIAFEIQDRALKTFEEGHDYLVRENIQSPWRRKILEALKQLDPMTYTPKDVLQATRMLSGTDWVARPDSVAGFGKPEKPDKAWSPAAPRTLPALTDPRLEGAVAIGGPSGGPALLKGLYSLNGKVNSATVTIAAAGAWKFFINGVGIAIDTALNRDPSKVDTFDVKNFLAGGDNALAFTFRPASPSAGVLVALRAILDTTLKFESMLGFPPAAAETPAAPPPAPVVEPPKPSPAPDAVPAAHAPEIKPAADSAAPAKAAPSAPAAQAVPPAEKAPASAPAAPTAPPEPAKPAAAAAPVPYSKEFRNYGEFQKAVAEATAREAELAKEVRAQQTRIRGIKFRINSVDESIKAAQNDIKVYRKILESKERRK